MRIDLRHGDCLNRLLDFDAGAIEIIVSDPPYELSFMGRKWDGTGIAYSPEFWGKVFQALASGGVVKVFGATRTFHRMCQAMEAAGLVLEPEDSLEAWVYGSGFPKSMNIAKAIDRMVDGEPEESEESEEPEEPEESGADGPTAPARSEEAQRWEGWGTALKPAWEPIVVGRKP